MKAIKEFDRTTCKMVSDHMKNVLTMEAKKFGLGFERGNGTFGDGTFSFKITFTTSDEDGNTQTKEAKDFLQYATLIGMKQGHLNSNFTSGGKTYTLVGYKPRSSKLPFICRNLGDSRLYKLSTTKVLKGLGLEKTEAYATAKVMENDRY